MLCNQAHMQHYVLLFVNINANQQTKYPVCISAGGSSGCAYEAGFLDGEHSKPNI